MPSQSVVKTKRVLIVKGPSKLDLMLTQFDSGHRGRRFTLKILDGPSYELIGICPFELHSVGFIDQKASPYGYGGPDAFSLSGSVRFDRDSGRVWVSAHGEYDTETRKGFLDLSVTWSE
jgi:hypothetical protein